jgi:putative peptide zinc metalloprotease protein
VQDLVVAYFLAHGTFAFGLIAGLVQQLFHKRMLAEQPHMVLGRVQQALSERSAGYRLSWPARVILTRQWAIGGLDQWLTRLYRAGGWVFYSLPAQIVYLLVSGIGLVLLVRILGDSRYNFGAGGLGANVALLWLMAILPVVIHELGHALTVKHYQREVHRGGLMLYFGMPAAFVDTTDIWLEGKKPRLAVTWAGPYTGFIIAGACAIGLWLWPGIAAAPLLLQTAVIAAFTSVLNLNPLLKLDGYYLLSDALEIPRLRERSLAFVQHKLAAKLVKRERFSRDEVIFVIFGALSAVWTVYIIYVSLVVWNARVAESVRALFASQGSLGARIGNLLLIVLGVSFLALIGAQVYRALLAVAARLRRMGIFEGPGRVAAAMAVGAVGLSVAVRLLPPTADGLAGAALSVAALLAAAYGSLNVARGLRGAHAQPWAWTMLAGAASFWALGQTFAAVAGGGSLGAAAAGVSGLLFFLAAIGAGILLFGGLFGSWRGWSLGLMLGGAAALVAAPRLAGLPTLGALGALLLAAGVWHWLMFRQPAILPSQSQQRPLSTADRLWDAFELLAEAMSAQLRAAYGRGAANRAQAQFDAASAELDWGINFANGQLAGGEQARQLPASDLAEVLADALAELLDEVEHLAGTSFAQRSLSRAYDALGWEQREAAEDYLLPRVRWAAGLAERFDISQDDVLALLRRAPLFVAFTPDELRAVAGRLRPEHYARGADILRQGEAGDRFYIVRRGRLAVVQQDAEGVSRQVNELVSGDYFGEAALLADVPRNATVRAVTPVEVLAMGRADFDRLVRAGFDGHEKVQAVLQRVGLLRRIPLFKDFESFELQLVAAQLEPVSVGAGEVLFEQGQPGDRFFIVETGEVAIRLRLPSGEKVEQARKGPGEYFGEIALLMDVPRTATVAATRPTGLLTLAAEPFQELVREARGFQRALERVGSGSLLENARLINRSLVDSSTEERSVL